MYTGVKEASERAILTLRSLQSQYVSAVRAATSSKKGSSTAPHPTTALFRSQDVLRPFLLACNYPDASSALLLIGLNAIQLLINGDAVCPEDSVHIARVLGIQAACCCRNFQNEGSTSQQSRGSGGVMASLIGAASSLPGGYYSSSSGSGHRTPKDDEAIGLKVLQTLTIMTSSNQLELGQEVLHQAISACLTLISGNESTKEEKNKKRNQRSIERDVSTGSSSVNGANENMRRAAASTLKQILLVTFERAGIHSEKNKEFHNMTKTAASSAFLDLCALSENREGGNKLKSEVTGPFLMQGGSSGKKRSVKPPPRSACFEILNMIINHTPALFEFSNDEASPNSEFAKLLRFKACPAISKVLLSEFHVTEQTLTTGSTDDRATIDEMGDREAFSLLLRSTRLACTILQKFGKQKDLASECHILLTAMIRFISSSSEAFRDNDKFEDGYIYSTIMQTLQNVDPQPSNSWRSTQVNSSESYPLLISNNLLWQSALGLESLFTLIGDSEMMKFLYSSDVTQKDQKNLVATIAETVSDFATTASSNKSGILSVVRTVSSRIDEISNSSATSNVILQPLIFGRASQINTLYDDWESSPSIDASLIQPNGPDTHVFDENQIPFCDDGEAIWLAFNCILSLSSSMRTLSSELAPQIQFLVKYSFAPIMAVLQHFLKRFPSENYILNRVLTGFKDLVDTCIPLRCEDGLHSEALIKTLCSLSLPNWGKMEGNW